MMNSKPMVAMKKFWMMLLAAATLVGCQKSEDVAPEADQITIKATMSFDAASRTTILEQDGNYLARWTEEDKYNIKLVGISSVGGFWDIDAKDIHLENDGETATFEFEMYPEMTDDSFTFVAVNSFAHYGTSSEAVWLQLKDVQTQDGQNYYDAHADLIVSKPIQVDRPTGDLNLNFTMARMNALLKLSLKNFTLAEEEKIQSVTFACEQPLAGRITTNFADLDGVTYPIPYTLTGEESKSITFDLQAGGDLYISTLPATLKAGESYTVTVKTNQKYLIKEGTLAADLVLTAGDITSVSVNMGDAATKSRVENLSEEYEYAIGYTDAEGKVWLLPRTAVNRRPSGHEVGAAGTGYNGDAYDLTGISMNAKGTIEGELADLYRWKIAKTDDLYNFYYTNSSDVPIYLIAYGEQDASGLAIKGYNTNGKFQAQYGEVYENTFSIVAKEGGYDIVFAPASGSATYKYVYFTGTQYRIGKTSPTTGVLNFYRIQPAPQKTIYPVITKAADITEGTYAFLAKKADGAYYALPNTKTVADGVNTCPTAYPLDVVSMTIENGVVTAAEIGNQYKWVITHRGETEQWDVRSALDMQCFLWQKPSGAGIAICTPDERNAVDTGFMPDWNFYDDAAKGMQAQTPNSAAHTTPRWLYVATNASTTTGCQWLGAKSATDAVVLVKISDSTEQIVTE